MSTSSVVKCFLCVDTFATNYSLKRHLGSIHGLSEEDIKQQFKSAKQILCHVCGKEIPSRNKLVEHLSCKHKLPVRLEEEVFNTYEGKVIGNIFNLNPC